MTAADHADRPLPRTTLRLRWVLADCLDHHPAAT